MRMSKVTSQSRRPWKNSWPAMPTTRRVRKKKSAAINTPAQQLMVDPLVVRRLDEDGLLGELLQVHQGIPITQEWYNRNPPRASKMNTTYFQEEDDHWLARRFYGSSTNSSNSDTRLTSSLSDKSLIISPQTQLESTVFGMMAYLGLLRDRHKKERPPNCNEW